MKRLEWKRAQPRAGPPVLKGYLGKYIAVRITLSICGRKDLPYECSIDLPGVGSGYGPFADEASAQAHAGAVVSTWIIRAGLDR